MTVQAYNFIRTDFSEPIISGESIGIGQPFLVFQPAFNRSKKEATITLHVDFTVEGYESDFRFNLKSKTIFKTVDAEDIVVSDVYDMHVKAIEDLRAYLDTMIGKAGMPLIDFPMPAFEQLLDEMIDFVGRLHART